MSRSTLRLAPRPMPAARSAKPSWANAFEGRGRGRAALRRAAWDRPDLFRGNFAEGWSKLIRTKCRTRNEAALRFDVTLQTACNWWSGTVCKPMGDKVALAALWWPEEFSRLIGGGR